MAHRSIGGRVHKHDHEHQHVHDRIRAMRLRGRVVVAVAIALALVYVQRFVSQWVDRPAIFISAFGLLAVFVLLFDWLLDYAGPPTWRFVRSVMVTAVRALATDPEVLRLRERYPRFSGWLGRRLTLESPTGLYLTVTVLVVTYFFAGFIEIARGVATAGLITRWDPQIFALLKAFRSPALTKFLWVFTVLGDPRVAFALTVVAIIVLELWIHRRDALFVAVSVGGGALLGELMKLVFERTGPDAAMALVTLPGSNSFPSAHALYSMLIAFSLAFIIARDARTFRAKLAAFAVAAFFALFTAVSRIYLGVHWMSDTVASWLLGLGWLSACIGALLIYERYTGVGRERPTHDHPQIRLRITIGVCIVAALMVVYGAQQDPLLAQATAPTPTHEWNVTLAADGTPRPTQAQVNELPRWAENVDGTRMSPIGLIFVGTRAQLLTAFRDGGWQVAETPTTANVFHVIIAAAADQPYPTAPVTPSFMNGHVHQFAFQKAVGTATARKRHHNRWWKTDFTVRGVPVWVATASLDAGVGMVAGGTIPTHRIAPQIDAEQRYVVQSLTAGGAARAVEQVRVTEPTTGTNAAGDAWFTEGMATLLVPAR